MAAAEVRSRAAAWTSAMPSGAIDGVNVTFTLPATPKPGTMRLELNGLGLMPGDEYILDGRTITMSDPPIGVDGDIPADTLFAYFQR